MTPQQRNVMWTLKSDINPMSAAEVVRVTQSRFACTSEECHTALRDLITFGHVRKTGAKTCEISNQIVPAFRAINPGGNRDTPTSE
jgi:hypothetical protein